MFAVEGECRCVGARDGQLIRAETEDYFYRRKAEGDPNADAASDGEQEKAGREAAARRLEAFVAKKLELPAASAATATATATAA
jgi:hypothetical protein